VSGIKDSQNDLEWFRQLVVFARQRQLVFWAFAGTRYLIDAAVLAGADGAIPSLANAFPELCVQAYELAIAGDFAGAAEVETRIIGIEQVAAMAQGGSPNAAILGFLKTVLEARGVIAHAADRSTALAHSGRAARGASTFGVLQALEEVAAPNRVHSWSTGDGKRSRLASVPRRLLPSSKASSRITRRRGA
jgi:4-hydroxy-tetrahydrodipicolinate synthase